MRDASLGWLAVEIEEGFTNGLLRSANANPTLEALKLCRGKMASFHDTFDRNRPNSMVAIMLTIVDVLCALFIVLCPFKYFLPVSLAPVQLWSVLAVFLLLSAYKCSSCLIDILENPFAGKYDVFNVDALLCSTEKMMFVAMRAPFDTAHRNGEIATADASGLASGGKVLPPIQNQNATQ